jgi:hypothetical protein
MMTMGQMQGSTFGIGVDLWNRGEKVTQSKTKVQDEM